MTQSKKWSINRTDLKSLGITMAIVVFSAVANQLIQTVPEVDFGRNSEIITVILVAILKIIQKLLQGK